MGGCRHLELDHGRHQEALGTSTVVRTQDIKTVYRTRMQSFGLSPRAPQPPTNLEPLWGCRLSLSLGPGLGWQGPGWARCCCQNPARGYGGAWAAVTPPLKVIH